MCTAILVNMPLPGCGLGAVGHHGSGARGMTIAAMGELAGGAHGPAASSLALDRAGLADGIAAVFCAALREWPGCEPQRARGEILRRLEGLAPAEWPPMVASFMRAALQAHVLAAHSFERVCEETAAPAAPGLATRVEA